MIYKRVVLVRYFLVPCKLVSSKDISQIPGGLFNVHAAFRFKNHSDVTLLSI